MMLKQILLFVLLAETMVSCAPLNLSKDCDSLSCGVFTSEEQIQPSSRSSQELHSDETAIYYEPAELDPQEPRVYSNYPFYIINPARKLILKTGRNPNKRRTKSTQEEKDADIPIPGDTALEQDIVSFAFAQDAPLYLDIGIQNPTEPRNAKEDNFQVTETNLLECLDLHILVFNRKSGDTTNSSELLETNRLKKYEAMSDADIVMAIQSKCSKPIDHLNKAIQEVKVSQPTHRSQFQEATETLTLDATSSEPFEISTRKSTIHEELELKDKQTEFPYFSDLEVMVISAEETQTDLPVAEPSPTSKNNASNSAAVKTIATTMSNEEIIFNKNSNDPVFDELKNNIEENGKSNTKELPTNNPSRNNAIISPATEMNIFASTEINNKYEKSMDDLNDLISDNVAESTKINFYALKEPTLETTTLTLESQTVESSAPKATSIGLYGDIAKSEEENDITEHTTESLKTSTKHYRTLSPISENMYPLKKDFSVNLINVSIPSPTPCDEESKNYSCTGKDTLVRTLNTDDSIRQGTQNNVPPVTTRSKYGEKAIKIPKIVSKEHVNGSVISTFGSFEKLPNNDFKEFNDSDEDSSIEDSNVDVISVKPLVPRDLTGKLFFVFDQLQVPAWFVQNPMGEIHIGINGTSLCDKLQMQNGDLLLFSKMCTFFNQSDSTRNN